MGGDGGVVATNRRYMRGAGTADHTADAKRKGGDVSSPEERIRTCAVSGLPLEYSPTGDGTVTSAQAIVVCPYGNLYRRENALQALLRRKQQQQQQQQQQHTEEEGQRCVVGELGEHIRGRKDLHPAIFRVVEVIGRNGKASKSNRSKRYVPVCPITGSELNGTTPAILIVKKDPKEVTSLPSSSSVNVLSERARKEMGHEEMEAEFGPIQDVIRLVPPASMLEEIKEKVKQTHLLEKEKKANKKAKKRKHQSTSSDGTNNNGATGVTNKVKRPTGTVEAAKQRVASAVASSEALSSLFTSQKTVSAKEKNDNLFAR